MPLLKAETRIWLARSTFVKLKKLSGEKRMTILELVDKMVAAAAKGQPLHLPVKMEAAEERLYAQDMAVAARLKAMEEKKRKLRKLWDASKKARKTIEGEE